MGLATNEDCQCWVILKLKNDVVTIVIPEMALDSMAEVCCVAFALYRGTCQYIHTYIT
jgi:hypothetical protein